MSIIIPSDLELLAPNDLIGHVPADSDDPLRTLLRRSNWHYATHAPACVNACPIADPAGQQEFLFPAFVSRDGLPYFIALNIWAAGATNVDVKLTESDSGTGVFTDLSISPSTEALAAGDNWLLLFDTIAADTEFMKLKLNNVTANIQCQAILVFPFKLGSISAPAKASGFIPFDEAHILAAPFGAAIHTEYLNRGWKNFRSTQADRHQAVFSYLQQLAVFKYRFTAVSQKKTFVIFQCPVGLTGRTTTDVIVKLRASESGSPSEITVGQVDGDSISLAANGLDQEGTLTLRGELPIVYAVARPDNVVEVRYITGEMVPDIGSVDELASGAAPPPRLEYLAALDALGLQATTDPYVVTGLNFNSAIAGGTYWNWGQMIPPAVYALRAAVGRSLDAAVDVTPADTEMFSTSSGVTAADTITIPPPISGSFVYPPAATGVVAEGSLNDETAPGAAQNRMFELVRDREPTLEEFFGRDLVAFAGRLQRVADLSSLP